MAKLTVEQQYQNEPKHYLRNAIVLFIVIGALVWSSSSIDFGNINDEGITIVKKMFLSFVTPTPKFLFGTSASSVLPLALETIAIAFLGTMVGAILAVPLSFLAARNIAPRFVNFFFQIGITSIRIFPVFVIGILVIRITGPGPFAGVITMGITSIGMMTKLYVEIVEGIENGVIDSLDSAGTDSIRKIRFGIIPQLSTKFLSTAIYRFEINVKNAAVLGLVGAGGIGFPLLAALSNRRLNDASAYLWGLAIMVIIIDLISNKIRKKLA